MTRKDHHTPIWYFHLPAQLNFGPSHMEKIYIPLPSTQQQLQIINYLNILEFNLSTLESKITASQSLHKSLINQMF